MTNVSIVRIGGVSAILAFVSFAAGVIVYFAGVEQVDLDDMAQVLAAMNDSRVASLTATWIVLAGYVLLIPAALGLFHALQEAGAVVSIAAAAMFTGALLFMGAVADLYRETIARFGRFPHRNALLGRGSSEEEREFLEAVWFPRRRKIQRARRRREI